MTTQQYDLPPHVKHGIAEALERGRRQSVGRPSYLTLWWWELCRARWERKLALASSRQAWAQQQFRRYQRLVEVGHANRSSE